MPKSKAINPLPTFAIVDDHRAVADIVGYALQTRLPAKCVGRCYNIEDARNQLPLLSPRVVITDWRIGNQSSALMVQEISPAMPETRWLLFTAWPTTTVLREMIPAGIHGCVSKSSDYQELANAINILLQGGRHFCQESLKALGQSLGNNLYQTDLNETERSILRCIAQGLEAKDITNAVNISLKTVHNYLVTIRKKLSLGSMVELANFAIREGIAPPR